MIIIYIGETALVDAEALWVESGRRPMATIRKHCTPVATHKATGRALYNVEQCKAILAAIPQRAPHRRKQPA